ncbi:hypothetical protein J4Q44_G00357420 [Coregonus suidteri]|uniref:Uncharacterized protein n=1 Tax=Coregonus suidteri TaxID=861788 RepID=A0AAN8KR25_9TELE
MVVVERGCPAEGSVRYDQSHTPPVPSGPRCVSAVRIIPLTSMKGSPDLIPSAELDPTRVCKGKGVVTLRATLVHIDDEDCVSEESNVDTAPSGWISQINGDSSQKGLADGGFHDITADLPTVNRTQPQGSSPVITEEPQLPASSDIQNHITSTKGNRSPLQHQNCQPNHSSTTTQQRPHPREGQIA